MGKTDPEAETHRQQSMMVVPLDTPGVIIVARGLPVFGYQDREGHAEVIFENVRVPTTALLAGEERGRGNADVFEDDFGVPFAILIAEHGKTASHDDDPGGVEGDDHHALLAMGFGLRIGLAHHDEHFAVCLLY